MTTKKKTIVSLCLFFLIFGGLLLTATFTDFQVSRILTKNTLPAGQYYATGVFGVVFECVGTAPELLLSSICAAMLTVWANRIRKPGAVSTLMTVAGGAATAGLYLWEFSDMFEYVCRHVQAPEGGPSFKGVPAFLWGIAAFLALLCAALTLFAVNCFSDETLKKLPRFACATMASIVVAILLVQIVKNPMGRMRYRSMNVIGDFSGYTPWYVANGQPDKTWMRETFGTADAFKSFPSGHTRAAAATFYLVSLADVIGAKSRGRRAALWCFAILFTGLVALSRIMVGAHFFSDVLVGGTIGFAVCMLSREFFLVDRRHLRALKGSDEKAAS
ncbi:MAG: phosphatase PAP2 family protein [Clostridia bacterium]|nr:phosphatase PAP2 family protein [Clostridia bacterium]